MSRPLIILTSIFTSIILVILVTSSILLYNNSRPLSSINVTEIATRKVTPQQARLQSYLVFQGGDVAQMNIDGEKKLSDVLNYLKSENIEEKNIKTNKSISPDYYYPIDENLKNQKQKLEISVELTFENLNENKDKAAKIANKLVELGVNRFNNWDYSFSNDQTKICNELENEAYQKGVENTKQKVKLLGGQIVSWSFTTNAANCGFQPEGYRTMMNDTLKGAGDAMSVAPGEPIDLDGSNKPSNLSLGEKEIGISVQVQAEYRI